jgi:hypothetical protein
MIDEALFSLIPPEPLKFNRFILPVDFIEEAANSLMSFVDHYVIC